MLSDNPITVSNFADLLTYTPDVRLYDDHEKGLTISRDIMYNGYIIVWAIKTSHTDKSVHKHAGFEYSVLC